MLLIYKTFQKIKAITSSKIEEIEIIIVDQFANQKSVK